MYKGNGHIHEGRFNRIGDFMQGYRSEGVRPGGRPTEEYRHARRNNARLSYRIAKKALKQGLVKN